jgi:hypothetical protein
MEKGNPYLGGVEIFLESWIKEQDQNISLSLSLVPEFLVQNVEALFEREVFLGKWEQRGELDTVTTFMYLLRPGQARILFVTSRKKKKRETLTSKERNYSLGLCPVVAPISKPKT